MSERTVASPPPRRVVAHLDCDAFYVSVELLRRPELRGKPVVVAGSGPRAVVTTASYEARKFGIGSASPASQARRRCPDAVFIPPDFTAYREKSREVWSLVRSRLDVVQVVGMDEGYADVTACEKPLRVLRALVADVERETGIVVSVGVGPNRLVAKVASDLDKPRGFVVLGREDACLRLASRSPRLIPGIGPKTADRLAELGYTTLGSLQTASEEELARTFGERQGRYLRRRAEFHDDAPVEPVSGPAKSRSNETTFPEDVADHATLEETLATLTHGLCDGLRKKEVAGRNIAIKVRLDDWTTVTRAKSVAARTNDPSVVVPVVIELFRAYAPARPVRLVGVRMAAFEEGAGEAAPAASTETAYGQLALPV